MKQRIEQIVTLIEELASGNFAARGPVTEAYDEIDAINVGLNLLADAHRDERERRTRSEAQLADVRALYERAPVGLFALRIEDGAIISCNETFAHMTRTTVVGLENAPLAAVISDESKPTLQECLERLRRGTDVVDVDLDIVGPDGATSAALLSAICVDEEGKRDRARCSIVDVERHKELEQQFAQAQKLEAVGRLAGGVAHDFNNLLTAIGAHLYFAKKSLPAESDVHENLAEIEHAVSGAADLTQRLLSFARKQMVRPKIVRSGDILRSCDRLLGRLLGEDVQVAVHIASSGWPVKVDPHRLEQVIINMAINSRAAMPNGGKLTIETANVQLTDAYANTHPEVEAGDYLMIAVSDDGGGMSTDVKARVFEPFFTTKAQGEGTGLGLAMCYGTIRQAGGHIWVYSEEGKGTTFKIYLPRVRGQVEGDDLGEAEPVLSVGGGHETILVIEDDAAVRGVIVQSLLEVGYNVIVARDGLDALSRARSHTGSIELLVTDVVMPRMSGKEAAKHLSADRPGIQVLFISGYSDNAIVHHGVLDPGIEFLQKPFTPRQLLMRVRQLLGN